MQSLKNQRVCVTGASSGIGTACAVECARAGASLLLIARRAERLRSLAEDLASRFGSDVHTLVLDVRDRKKVEASFASLPPPWRTIDILINNAGLSRGLEPLHEGKIDDWDEMIDTNVKGLLYVSRSVIPGMVERNKGHVINIGSIAGHQTYPGGNVYSASKFAVVALSRSLKMDLLGTAVRVTNVEPGLVETEFSEVRFHGDTARASKVYEGYKPLSAEDVADIVLFCATRPPHVNLLEVLVVPTDQASATMVNKPT
ncbi:MAG: SDR family oxidoreductase [Ignavibacteria bacterium]|nr:SDR family oxidoreductase [Ignavibacteria bacterium]